MLFLFVSWLYTSLYSPLCCVHGSGGVPVHVLPEEQINSKGIHSPLSLMSSSPAVGHYGSVPCLNFLASAGLYSIFVCLYINIYKSVCVSRSLELCMFVYVCEFVFAC